MQFIPRALVKWYTLNHRDLPWRHTHSAYHIWLSEIIMQQTQVIQGTPYYLKFINSFEDICALAKAPEDQIMSMWQGLGYYSRARNLHKTAKLICADHKGVFPSDYKQILKLPGIGPYTAAAISTFAFKQPKPLVDGNVYRLFSRLFGINTPINTSTALKEFSALTSACLDKLNTSDACTFNQAIMEFGALVCKPKTPDCLSCVLKTHCFAFENGLQNSFPVKLKAKAKVNRYFHYFLIQNSSQLLWIEKRGKGDIWNGLYQLPMLEQQHVSEEDCTAFFGSDVEFLKSSEPVKHVLSHQNIFAQFHHIQLSETRLNTYTCISSADWTSYGFPQLIVRFLEKEFDF